MPKLPRRLRAQQMRRDKRQGRAPRDPPGRRGSRSSYWLGGGRGRQVLSSPCTQRSALGTPVAAQDTCGRTAFLLSP